MNVDTTLCASWVNTDTIMSINFCLIFQAKCVKMELSKFLLFNTFKKKITNVCLHTGIFYSAVLIHANFDSRQKIQAKAKKKSGLDL